MPTSATAFETLELRGVGRSFGGQVALADLNLTVRAGEFIALLGPSGCGKSTALNCLAGLLPLTGGQILIDGARVDTVAAEQRGFGMVFQNYALFPHMTVRRNIAFGLQMRRLPREEISRRVKEAVSLVRLEEHADKLPGQLSGGQQQRVAIARVIALEPRLVLMDEPLSNLDAKLRLEMRTEIRKLHQSLGFTTVYVTHDQEEALSMADRLVVLRAGSVQQVGTPQDLYENPANWHVADFMGYRNLIDVAVGSGPVAAGGTVRVHGQEVDVEGTAVERLTSKDEAVLAIRPEDLRIVEPSGEGTEGNTFDGTVSVVEYQGREFSVDVVLESGRSLHVRSPQAPHPGDQVRLHVPTHRALVYRTDLDRHPDDEDAS